MASTSAAQSVSGSKSARLASQRKVMDEATRRRRARKALESLEQDNFHDDPHADLVMSKKALNLFQESGDSPTKEATPKMSSKRKSRTTEYYKQRFRKNFAQLLEEDTTSNDRFAPQQLDKKEDEGDKKKAKKAEAKKKKKVVNYISAQAPPSTKPIRHFCAVCGFNDRLYTCVVCGMKYCSLTCQETHRDTRCLKYTS